MSDSQISIQSTCTAECNSCTSNLNPLFAGLDIEQRKEVDGNRMQISFNKGEYIFREGLFPSGLFCLRKGKVMVVKSDKYGNSIIVNLHKEVTFLGIAEYMTQLPYQTKCIALEDSMACLIKDESIRKLISENKTFNHRLLETLSSQYLQSNNRLIAITKKQMSARLADALLELHDVFGDNKSGHIDVYLKRSDLALLCNMSESNTIRYLSAFQKSGILELQGKKIKILQEKQLVKESQYV